MIIIQKIENRWTKKSRGFPHSQKRSEVQEVYPFSLRSYYSDVSVVLQTISCNEATDFHPTLREREINHNQIREEQLELIQENGTLAVGCWGRNSSMGKIKKIGSLKKNQWLQIILNERVPLEYTTGYRKWVYNISFLDKNEISNISKNPPIISVDLQTQLF